MKQFCNVFLIIITCIVHFWIIFYFNTVLTAVISLCFPLVDVPGIFQLKKFPYKNPQKIMSNCGQSLYLADRQTYYTVLDIKWTQSFHKFLLVIELFTVCTEMPQGGVSAATKECNYNVKNELHHVFLF